MLGYLKDVFSKVPNLIISITISPNIFDYIWVSLKLRPPSWIYRLSLDPKSQVYDMPYSKTRLSRLSFSYT